jgi:hypothetical protein
MIFTPGTEAAIRADFALGRVLDDVLDDPFAQDAEERLQAAADQAYQSAEAAGLLDVGFLAWLKLLSQHPDYPVEVHRHRLATERRERPGTLLDQMETAVKAGDGVSCQGAYSELREMAAHIRLVRWLGGTS